MKWNQSVLFTFEQIEDNQDGNQCQHSSPLASEVNQSGCVIIPMTVDEESTCLSLKVCSTFNIFLSSLSIPSLFAFYIQNVTLIMKESDDIDLSTADGRYNGA